MAGSLSSVYSRWRYSVDLAGSSPDSFTAQITEVGAEVPWSSDFSRS